VKVILFILIFLGFSVVALSLISSNSGAHIYTPIEAQAANSTYIFSGYAWSDNIGWISFNCIDTNTCATSNYNVGMDDDGNISGYAWANPRYEKYSTSTNSTTTVNNIGWISFNPADVASCPTAPCAPKVDLVTGAVTGWAKALSAVAVDGWDGWIKLSGTNFASPTADGSRGVTYLPLSGYFNGYAWGSDSVGWINFKTSVSVVTITNPPDATDGIDNDNDGFTDGQDPGTYVYNPPTGDPTGPEIGNLDGSCKGVDGVGMFDGDSKVFYKLPIVASGSSCSAGANDVTLNCSNGVLYDITDHDTHYSYDDNHGYQYAGCSVQSGVCTRDGVTLQENQSATFYSKNLVGSTQTCASNADPKSLTCHPDSQLYISSTTPDGTNHPYATCSVSPNFKEI
jgi:hypothetical protein